MMHLNLINSSEPPARLLSCQHGQVIGQYKHGSRDFLTGTQKTPWKLYACKHVRMHIWILN